MNEQPPRRPVRGIVPPMVTPLSAPDQLDLTGLNRLIEHLIAGGVAGIFILGSTGEAASLSQRLRTELMQATCEIVAGQVPVWVGVTDSSHVETLRLSHAAATAGADAVVVTAPFYYIHSQPELLRCAESIAEQSSLPVVLYNMPSFTKTEFSISTVAKLADHANIIGMKDSGGDIGYFRKLVQLKSKRPDWTFLVGPETVLAESIRLGGDGGVHGGANIFPRLFVSLFNAFDRQDDTMAQSFSASVSELRKMYDVEPLASRIFKATKCALSLKGICSDVMAEPFSQLTEDHRNHIAAVLKRVEGS